ncbi:S-adenosyl-L-methionine-dependent methyltransferase [Aspergillus cavernicola]|uniref:S-adenosyl-L-methionine-dependent methyltransferase n=1 Tax=Aspergillus cavernicola TaxID=176166 RepID=A0ABR4IB96_9EURO
MSEPAEIYPLGRDTTESTRLNEQHKLIMDIVGGSIDKTVPLDNVHSVADIATGTGVWLRDAQKALNKDSDEHQRYYHGFDISAAQFPITSEGIELSVQDVLKPFPPEHHNRYDLVHVRLLVTAIKEPELQAVVSNLRTILKPGGFLQWIEIDFTGLYETPVHPKAAEAVKLWLQFIEQHGISQCAPKTLQVAYEKAGLVNTTSRTSFIRGHEDLTSRAQAWQLEFFATVVPLVLRRTGQATTDEEVSKKTLELIKDVELACAAGEVLDLRFGTVVGQKPSPDVL